VKSKPKSEPGKIAETAARGVKSSARPQAAKKVEKSGSTRPRKVAVRSGQTPGMVASSVSPAPAAATSGPALDRESMIRVAAYELYERRGGAPGHALEDWVAAEALVDARLAAPSLPAVTTLTARAPAARPSAAPRQARPRSTEG